MNIAETRPDMNIKVAFFTVSETYVQHIYMASIV